MQPRPIARAPFLCLVLATVMSMASPANAQWQIDSKDGKSNIKVGFLAQPQMEVVDTPDGDGQSRNLFLRRFRLLVGGKLNDTWTFFFETDSPNLGKANPDKVANPSGAKDAGFMYLQDAYVTYNRGDAFKIDGGMILTPLGHNHGQSAATLLPVDYGPYTFLEAAATGERVGRDYGFQLRGYPFKQHLEYRLGVFQGARTAEAKAPFRIAGRLVWYPFAADTGFFYSGTFQGSKRVWAIGAAFDRQKEYGTYSADVFVEEPINKGQQGLTFQANWMRFDGDTFLKSLPKQDAILVEGAFHFAKGRVSPFVQFASRDFENQAVADQSTLHVGVAYWMAGHSRNVKISAGRLHTSGLDDRLQVLAQLQLFQF